MVNTWGRRSFFLFYGNCSFCRNGFGSFPGGPCFGIEEWGTGVEFDLRRCPGLIDQMAVALWPVFMNDADSGGWSTAGGRVSICSGEGREAALAGVAGVNRGSYNGGL